MVEIISSIWYILSILRRILELEALFKSKYFISNLIFSILFINLLSCNPDLKLEKNLDVEASIEFWLTDPNNDIKFSRQITSLDTGHIQSSNYETISINTDGIYQTMDGFGFALTGGSALHISNLSPNIRSKLLNELFDSTETNIGVSYIRLSIGSSDLDQYVYSNNDLDLGQTDIEMNYFSIEEDKKYIIPVMKQILDIIPNIKILASPWSPPTWMKTNNSSIGGSLRTEYYQAYSNYFVNYIEHMQSEGILIDAITIQNEPLHPHNNPSMLMLADEQANFIKNHLGPTFLAKNLKTKIIIYDHNADRVDYPILILNDEEARQYIDGSAFHLYAGDINDISTVQMAHPDKNLYFTEQWIGAPGNFSEDLKWHVRNLLIGASRNWCKNIIEWNLAADENQDPHTPGGCTECLGAVTIANNDYIKNPGFYIIAHIAKFVRPGSKRVYSTTSPDLPNVSFKTNDNKLVTIVLNDSESEIYFNIKHNSSYMNSKLSSGAVGTYIWDIEL